MSNQRPGDTIPHQQETEAVIDARLAESGGGFVVGTEVAVDVGSVVANEEILPSDPTKAMYVTVSVHNTSVDTTQNPNIYAWTGSLGGTPNALGPGVTGELSILLAAGRSYAIDFAAAVTINSITEQPLG